MDVTIRLVGGTEGAATIPAHNYSTVIRCIEDLPAIAVVSMVTAGGLSPAVFLAMMEIP